MTVRHSLDVKDYTLEPAPYINMDLSKVIRQKIFRQEKASKVVTLGLTSNKLVNIIQNVCGNNDNRLPQ